MLEVKPEDKVSRFREWYKLLKSYGADGERLMRVEYRFWKYFWQRKFVARHVREDLIRHGRFSIIPPYKKDQEEKDFLDFKDSFLKGQDRENGLMENLESVERNLSNIEGIAKKILGVESQEQFLGIILFGSGYLGPRDFEKDPKTDIDVCLVVEDELFNSIKLSNQNEVSYLFDEEKKRIQIFFVGRSEIKKPPFSPIHFLATPFKLVKSYIPVEKFYKIRNKVVEETVKDIRHLEELVSSYEEELLASKRERIKE